MVTVEDLRQIMKSEAERHKRQKTVELWGSSIEEALKQASIELQTPVHRLEYEVLIKGSSGLLGQLFKKEWRLLVYPSAQYKPSKHFGLDGVEADGAEGLSHSDADRPGDFGLRLGKDGSVFVKIIAPQGRGLGVTAHEIIHEAASRNRSLPHLNREKLEEAMSQATGKWVKIDSYSHNEASDSQISIAISEDDMKASITLSTPGAGGATPTVAEMREALKNAGIFYGIKDEALDLLERRPQFRTPVLVAEGIAPYNGLNSIVEFLFQTEFATQPLEVKSNGSVDFKSASRIQSVSAGQPVANILPPQTGKEGRTVTGKLLPAKDGAVQEIPLGSNVKFSADKTQIIATADGQATLVKGVVSVETIFIVDGNLRNHVDFLGTVLIKGDIEDGYDVKAQGDIFISGSVGRSKLTAGGDIFVDRGINGDISEKQQQVFVKCGKSLWASFIQNCYAEAGEFVIVSDGIVNSAIIASQKVLCKGRRAAIVGGNVRAGDEINAVALGSASGTLTRLEVGADPKVKDALTQLAEERRILEGELKELEKSLANWLLAAKNKSLPPDRKRRLDELGERRKLLARQLDEHDKLISRQEEFLRKSSVAGKISASRRVNAGVTIVIHDVEYEVTNEYERGITFYEAEGLIHTKNYEEITEDLSRKERPDKN